MSDKISQALNAINDKRIAKAVQQAFDRTGGTGAVAALGTNQATAAVLVNAVNYVTGADATKGVILRLPEPGDPGVWVINTNASNALPIYPQVGGAINALAANAAFTLAAAQAVFLVPATPGQWYAGIVGATSAQIAYLTGAVAGTSAASKCVVLGASGDIDTIAFGAITGSDASLGITGLAAAQGGAVVTTGGTSSTAGNAGGAVSQVGGTPGATGVGGASSVVGGAGGATSGAGGVAALTGGAGTAGNSIGGAATVTGGAGQGTAAGAVASLTGGASGAGATGNGGAANVTGGAAASTNGNGGSVVLTPGAKSGTGVVGVIRVADTLSRKVVVTAMTTTATISVAALRGGMITANQGAAGAATYTMPTGTVMDAAMPADFAAGDSFDFTITNISTNAAEDVTVAGDTGMVAKGNVFIPSNAATSDVAFATFRVVKEAANTYSFYRVG